MTFDEFLHTPGTALTYLAKNDLLSACEPMAVSQFVRFCTDRGLNVDADRLEALERLGLFYPFVRISYPKIKIKCRAFRAAQLHERPSPPRVTNRQSGVRPEEKRTVAIEAHEHATAD